MKLFWRALCLCVLALPTSLASAASYYMHIPGINGEQSVPGFPNAMNVKSLTIAPQEFFDRQGGRRSNLALRGR
ncbi:MAG: hypothetical protein H7Z14_08435 [Anaerolineae bacterium]|nr:hypothetical protein [Phycisphaerae bacterium]